MLSRYLSLRAITIGLVVLIGLAVIFWALPSAALFAGGSSTVAVLVAALLYACGGYVTGVLAGHHQTLNAFAVGVLFGGSIWLALRLFLADTFAESSISVDYAGMGAALFAVLACGIGGVVSVVAPFRRRRS
jgi:hypothetical protein